MTGRGKRVVVIGARPISLVNFRGPLIRAMVERGHQVTALAPQAHDEVRRALEGLGAAYRSMALDRTGRNPLADLRGWWGLARLLQELRPEVLLSYNIKPVIYASLAARIVRVPERFAMITGTGYAFTAQGTQAWVARTLARCLYRLSLAQNQRVFFQNPDDLALFTSLGILRRPDRAIIINGSGVDLQQYTLTALPNQISFLMLGRLLKDKGVREYVEAARLIKKRYPHVRFRLAGRFDTNPMSIAENELRSWHGSIDYLGHLNDVRPAIMETAVYVLPSYHEGTPRTVLEAMAMGRPIVTTDVPGCRETVVNGRNGFLVPPRNANALAEALERFLQEPGLVASMGAASRELAEAKYDVHKVNAVILEAMAL